MIKKVAAIAALTIIPLGCTSENNEATTTTTVPEPTIIEAMRCINVGNVAEDPLINNALILGIDLDYKEGMWYLDDEPVGEAELEDEAFALCVTGESESFEILMNERIAIANAGGYPG